MRKMLVATAALAVLGLSSIAQATTTTVVTDLPTKPWFGAVAGKWYSTDVASGGTASIVNLAGLGGNLETEQPLPTGAAKLTTNFTNNSKAEVGMSSLDFGLASTVLKDIELGYDYYKQYVANANTFAAPSLKLTISAGAGHSGTLIYEPYMNGSVTTNTWTAVSIDSSTGAGNASGGWWWNGGFNTAKNLDAYKSLSEWADVLAASDATYFPQAHVTGVSMGIGTWNQGQIDYFDNISIKSLSGNVDVLYNFYPVPEPSSILALLGGLGSLLALRRRKA